MKASDLYETPPEIFEYASIKYGPFDRDVCAQKTTKKCPQYIGLDKGDDAFEMDWGNEGDRLWMNPPYSNPKPWVEKARFECNRNKLQVCALLPADISTTWFRVNLLENRNCFIDYLPRRVRFFYNGKRCGSPKFGNVLVVFFPEVKAP